jgi:hypothetical protein
MVAEVQGVDVKRDMDLVRGLLISLEENQEFDGSTWLYCCTPQKSPRAALCVLDFPGHSLEEINYHASLLVGSGFVKGKVKEGKLTLINSLTWDGHEFLDNIKDVGVWEKTKERLHGIPGVALGVVAAIAEAEIKKRLGLS